MYRVTGLMATTHLDLHNERLAKSALIGMAEQVRRTYVPVMWNHDIRFPPLGRVVRADVISLPDGEFGLETESEHWEPGDPLDILAGDGRTLVRDNFEGPGFEVRVDRGLSSSSDRRAALAIAKLSGRNRRPIEMGKKALEVDAVLTIAIGVVTGSIAVGILNALGEDIYNALKVRLQDLANVREVPLLIDFDITFDKDRRRTVHVLLDGPNAVQIGDLFDRRFNGLDVVVEECLLTSPEIDEVVMTWSTGASCAELRGSIRWRARPDGACDPRSHRPSRPASPVGRGTIPEPQSAP